MTRSYISMKIDDFSLKGRPIRFANANCLSDYEQELKGRDLDYVVVKGFGDFGVGHAIIVPGELEKYRTILMGRIARAQEHLNRHEDGLKELEAELSARISLFGDKKEESNEDEAGSEIEYREGDPHKPRQFYKAGQKYIIDG